MIYFENDDGRVCIVFPYLGKVLVGSTDIRVERRRRRALRGRGARLHPRRRCADVFPGIAVSAERRSSSATAASARCRAATTSSPAASRATISSTRSTAPCRSSAWSAASGRRSAPSPSRRPTSVLAELGRAAHDGHRWSCRSAAAPAFRPTPASARQPRSCERYGIGAARAALPRRPLRHPRRRSPALLPRRGRRRAARRRLPDDGGRDRLPRPQRDASSHSSDILLRRTSLSITRRHLDRRSSSASPAILAGELGWDAEQTQPRDRDIHRASSPTITASRARCSPTTDATGVSTCA